MLPSSSPDQLPPEAPPPPSSEEDRGPKKIADAQAAERRKMKARRNLIFIVAGTVIAGTALWVAEQRVPPIAKLGSLETVITNEIQQSFSSYPAPLVTSTKSSSARISASASALTRAGVIQYTNAQRATQGLPALAESAALDAIASLRLDDMFEYQYFAHVSPTGESAETVASSVGYQHLALGENLAEGIFPGDSGVVAAWMGSPGHRANILNTHYTEIGVAVRKGAFQGQQAWIAVQVFGKPASACPAPDANLKAAIDSAQSTLSAMNGELQQLKAGIDAMQPQSGAAYNDKVQQYNTLVDQYNALAAQTKTEIAQYNGEVNAFNACL